LQAIHDAIFQDVYDWAGQLRTVDIGKGAGQFAHVAYLIPSATKLFSQLAQEQHLQGLALSQFAQRAAYYFGEVNALHPFREGNGRTQRMFFFLLAREDGFFLDWTSVTSQEMIDASSRSLLRGDNQGLEQILLTNLSLTIP
jgi:cell filamentation protein